MTGKQNNYVAKQNNVYGVLIKYVKTVVQMMIDRTPRFCSQELILLIFSESVNFFHIIYEKVYIT